MVCLTGSGVTQAFPAGSAPHPCSCASPIPLYRSRKPPQIPSHKEKCKGESKKPAAEPVSCLPSTCLSLLLDGGDRQGNNYLPDVGQHPLPPPPPPPPARAVPGCRLTDQRTQAKNGIHYFARVSDIFKLLGKKKEKKRGGLLLFIKKKRKREENTLWSKPPELAPSFSQLLLVGAALRSHLLQHGMGEILPAPAGFKAPSLSRRWLLTRTGGARLLPRAGLICEHWVPAAPCANLWCSSTLEINAHCALAPMRPPGTGPQRPGAVGPVETRRYQENSAMQSRNGRLGLRR